MQQLSLNFITSYFEVVTKLFVGFVLFKYFAGFKNKSALSCICAYYFVSFHYISILGFITYPGFSKKLQ